MQTIRINLRESGSIADIKKDFNLYAGSYHNVLLSIAIPKTLLLDNVERDGTEVSNVITIGGIGIGVDGRQTKTKRFYLKYVKDFLFEGREYTLYERRLPRAFVLYEGLYNLVANILNIVTDEDGSHIEQITTSQTCELRVLRSDYLDEEEPEEPSELMRLAGRQDTVEERMDETQESLEARVDKFESDITKFANEFKTDITEQVEEISEVAKSVRDDAAAGKFIGEQGPRGEQGPMGATGSVGAVGPQGPLGVQGIQGERGPEGPQGPKGDIGAKGDKGDSGINIPLSSGFFRLELRGDDLWVVTPDGMTNPLRIENDNLVLTI